MEDNKLIAEFIGWIYIPWNNLQGYSDAGWWKYQEPLKDNKSSFFNYLEKSSKDKSTKIGKQFYICRLDKDLKFNTSWDWIMPVVEKIERLNAEKWDGVTIPKYLVSISDNTCTIGNGSNLPIYKEGQTKLEATYNACVEFIKEYNETIQEQDN